MRNIIIVFFIFLAFAQLQSQRTVGTISLSDEALDGLTFFSPFSSNRAFLVDNCGRLINEWNRGTRPGLAAYFLDNGQILRTYKTNPEGPFTSASNAGGIELVDWDNSTIWSYELNTATELSHHDAVFMPNGNILLLTWELVYADELIEKGRDPNEIAPQGFAWNERIIEIEPIGNNEANIIWEWRIKDHYIQNFDASKSNFGVVSEHPELFNINLPELNSPNSHSDLDYNHFNAIDYHPELDQILISVRNSDEIWIIDHSTTTAEAASHSGGRYGKGGDILYRWGNAFAYDRASIDEEQLFGQHGTHWVKEGPLKDKILIYNNGNGRPGQDFSLAEILTPDQNDDGSYTIPEGLAYGPESTEWNYGDQSGQNFYSPYLSNAQALSNGNFLINAGSPGYIFEINPAEEIVWEYIIPLFGDFPATQGDNINNNGTFRAYKYPMDFKGFENKDLTPGSTIEFDSNPLDCFTVNINALDNPTIAVEIIVDATGNLIFKNSSEFKSQAQFIDLLGNSIYKLDLIPNSQISKAISLSPGIYLVQLYNKNQLFETRKIFLR